MSMFCYQCQETAGNVGCKVRGVCGKTDTVANLQDLLIWITKGLSEITTRLRKEGKAVPKSINHLVTTNLFTTITNANFDEDAIDARIRLTLDEKKKLMEQLDDKENLSEAAQYDEEDGEKRLAKSETVGVLNTEDEDVRSLRELTLYGLKGLSAYTKHANVLLKENEDVDIFIQRALADTMDDSKSVDELVNLVLETGKYGVEGMASLDEANTGAYGHPEITKVNLG